jgi:hypothetical protein
VDDLDKSNFDCRQRNPAPLNLSVAFLERALACRHRRRLRVLLDECVDASLAASLGAFEVRAVSDLPLHCRRTRNDFGPVNSAKGASEFCHRR